MFGATGFIRQGSSANQTVSSVIGGSYNLTKTGTNTLVMSSLNTYTGVTRITTLNLQVSTLANGGVSCGIGSATNAAANLIIRGTLLYTGAAVTIDRNFTILNGTTAIIRANGSGALTLTGGTTATNGQLTANGTQPLILNGTYPHTGNTNVQGSIGGTGTLSGPLVAGATGFYFGGLGSGNAGILTAASLGNFSSGTSHLRVYSDGVSLSKITVTTMSGNGNAFVDLMEAMPAGTFTIIACTGTLPAGTPTIGTNSSGRTPTVLRVPGIGYQLTLV